MVQLRVCEQCQRHVHIGESACPFCQAELAPQPLDLRRKSTKHLSRAQRFAAAMSMAAVPLVACSETTTAPANGGSISSGGQAATGGTQGGSGGAGVTGGLQSTGGAGMTGGEFAIPLYGAVFPTGGAGVVTGGTDSVDASAPNDAGVDAGEDAGPVIVPAYGLPVYGAPPAP